MSKVKCERMKGRQLNTSFGKFQFDSKGVVEVSDEDAEKLLALKGYKLVDEQESAPDDQEGAKSEQVDKNPPENENTQDDDENDGEQDDNDDDEPDEDAEKKSGMTVEYLNGKNVAQLKKIAKDKGIDLAGATKKDEIIPIILGNISQ